MSKNEKITLPLKKAVAVRFLNADLDSDSFVENGMTAWLTNIEWDNRFRCYQLYFDFTDFEDINRKYFTETFYTSTAYRQKTGKETATALEVGCYKPKYSLSLDVLTESGNIIEEKNDRLLEIALIDILPRLKSGDSYW